jgi:hypothetical protein
MTMKNDNYRNIMKLNWFVREWLWYVRKEDWILIEYSEWERKLVYPDGTVIYCDNKEKLIGELVLRNIVNRLFF